MTSAAKVGLLAAPIRIAPDDAIRPAVCSVSEFTFDSGSKEFISDEAILKNLQDDDCGETASFALEGYVTTGGDTLRSLAKRYSLDVDALATLNGRKSDELLPSGTRINLYRGDVTLYTAIRGETLEEIARKFGTDALLLTVCNHTAATTMEGGEKLFVPQGILEREGEADVEDVAPPAPAPTVEAPKKADKPEVAQRAERSSHASKRKGGRFEKVINFSSHMAWPVNGKLSSRFGWRHHPILNCMRFHSGIDISAPSGAPIRSIAEGRVIYSGWRNGSGRTVVIRHADNMVSIYAHCSRLTVAVGQSVSSGQVVGRIGSSGLSTGSHLHFALERGKTPINPMKYLR